MILLILKEDVFEAHASLCCRIIGAKRRKEEKTFRMDATCYCPILWLVKLITNSLEKVSIKSKRVIEKVTVE